MCISLLQKVDGVSFSEYSSQQVAFQRVFISTISASVSVSADSIVDLVVLDVASAALEPSTPPPPTHLRSPDRGTSSDAVGLQYTIQVPSSSGMTYNQLSSALTSSVQSGQFTSQMQAVAAAQGVPELSSASSSSIETQDTSSPPVNSRRTVDNGLSAGAVAVLLCGFVMFRMYVQRVPERSGFRDLNKPCEDELFSTSFASNPLHQQGEQ